MPKDPGHKPLSLSWSCRVEELTCLTFDDVSLLSNETRNVDFDISENQESKILEKPFLIWTAPPNELTPIACNPSSSNERHHVSKLNVHTCKLTSAAADDEFVICWKAPSEQVLVLPSRCLVRPAANDDFVIK